MKKSKIQHKKKRKRHYRNPPTLKGKRGRFVWLNVLPDDIWIKVKRGVTLWEALQKTDVNLEGECGGLGKCGKCKVKVITALGPASAEAREHLTLEELEQGIRLACRMKIKKDLVVYSEVSDEDLELYQILKYGETPPVELNPLIEKLPIELTPPSLEDPLSDVERIREALGPEYQSLQISHRCLTTLYGDLRASDFRGAAVLCDGRLLAWQPMEMVGRRYGLIFDLGTSTLVGKLVSLLSGQEVAVGSRLNSQNRYGADLITRIQYVMEYPGGLTILRERLVRDLNIIIKRLLKADNLSREDIFVGVVAGNTTMQHFLLGADPRGIAEAPFIPVITEGITVKAREIGLELHPEAIFHFLPAKSGYIGGDLIGFILASGAAEQQDRLVLGLDFGTNGEIFLGNGKRMLTCSAAAGPALEGARITHGMIGKAGAIEGVRFEDNYLHYRVIGNIPPKGICGSGLVDLVAVLLHHGFINSEGLMSPPEIPERDDMIWRMKSREGKGIYDFHVASPTESFDGRNIYLTQNDIRELQLAKGAIAAGIKRLLTTMGATIDDVDKVYLAGALGNYINPLSAMRIGLVPRVDPEKIIPLGNAASTGAQMVLLSRHHWERASEIAHLLEHMELSCDPDFFDHFVEEMDFPEENLW